MTFGEMLQYTNRLKEIMNGPDSLRDSRLASLMSDLEQAYNIQTLDPVEFEKENPFVMRLYLTVSELRNL